MYLTDRNVREADQTPGIGIDVNGRPRDDREMTPQARTPPFTPEGLRRHGFSLSQVKEWREKEHAAGRPSGLDDFYRAHSICVACGGHGWFIIGVRWRDADGIERSEEGGIAALLDRHGLNSPKNWLTDARKWDYLYETCEICRGLGHDFSCTTGTANIEYL
jgi:hypothetical protein